MKSNRVIINLMKSNEMYRNPAVWGPVRTQVVYRGLKVLGTPLGISRVSAGEPQVLPRGALEGSQNDFRGSPGGLKGPQKWAHQTPKYAHGADGDICVQGTSTSVI